MKTIIYFLALFIGWNSYAVDLPSPTVTEKSVQLTIKGTDDGKSDWFLWTAEELDKFNHINTFVIHPIASDHKTVSYKGCASTCNANTESYLQRLALQVKEVKASNSNHRVYVGVPHAVESYNIPTLNEIRAFMGRLANVLATHNVGLSTIKGIYITDEVYYGSVAGISFAKKENTTGLNSAFQYFVNLRLIMNEYRYLNTMPIMWMPQYRREKSDSHISQLLNWQNNNSTIINRIVIQPGYYNKNAGQYYSTALSDVYAWVNNQRIDSVFSGGNTRLGAMIETSPAVDWCTDYVRSGSTLLDHGNITYRPQYTQQHSKFNGISGYVDTNFFISQRTSEWNNHTLDWEKNEQGATLERGNPFVFIDRFYENEELGYNSMNQSSYCIKGEF